MREPGGHDGSMGDNDGRAAETVDHGAESGNRLIEQVPSVDWRPVKNV
jgi:hypothetical protein